MPRRTKLEKEKDLASISDRYLRGYTQMQIAEDLGLNQSTICRDMAILEKRWRQSQLTDTNLAIQVELERISNMEREYWEAWERSKQEKVVRQTKRKTKGQKSAGKGTPETTDESGLKTEQQIGNPRFLEGVRWCVEARIKLLGLLPNQRDPFIPPPPESEDVPAVTDSGRVRELATILDRARDRAGSRIIEGTATGVRTETGTE